MNYRKQFEISLDLSYIVITHSKEKLKIKFQSISLSLLQVIAQSIFVRFSENKDSKFKLSSCLTNDKTI